jgi:cell wall-associated NlpC family hydrolase
LRTHATKRVAACALAATVGILALASNASAQTGGATPPGEAPPPAPPTAATLLPNGRAIAPANAPTAVVDAIAAANKIRKTRYVWGGGHRRFIDRGYDCSGAVSYALHGAGILSSPMPSGPFMRWGTPGPGAWITVYANGGHMFAVIAGLRWDTSAAGFGSSKGARWRATMRPAAGYAVRHVDGL